MGGTLFVSYFLVLKGDGAVDSIQTLVFSHRCENGFRNQRYLELYRNHRIPERNTTPNFCLPAFSSPSAKYSRQDNTPTDLRTEASPNPGNRMENFVRYMVFTPDLDGSISIDPSIPFFRENSPVRSRNFEPVTVGARPASSDLLSTKTLPTVRNVIKQSLHSWYGTIRTTKGSRDAIDA